MEKIKIDLTFGMSNQLHTGNYYMSIDVGDKRLIQWASCHSPSIGYEWIKRYSLISVVLHFLDIKFTNFRAHDFYDSSKVMQIITQLQSNGTVGYKQETISWEAATGGKKAKYDDKELFLPNAYGDDAIEPLINVIKAIRPEVEFEINWFREKDIDSY